MTISAVTGQPFPRGLLPTPAHVLLSAEPYSQGRELRAPPPQLAYVPPKLDYWGNDRYGVCVTSESAFTKACYEPEIFIPADTVISWARNHGVLNGASLDEVLDAMNGDGFRLSSQRYDEGQKLTVDYSNESALQSAIAQGPVKIAIAADALPSGAGNHQGWYVVGGQRYRSTDHCVSLAGYGTASYLYQRLGVALPSGLPATKLGYLLFTWSTIGFVDFPWLMGTCQEAWVRDPSTVGVPPLPSPVPPPTPVPDPTPTPVPIPPGPTPTPVPPGPTPVPPSPIIVTGELTIPFWGPVKGDITATCGGQTNVFSLKNVRGRVFRIEPKKNTPTPRPRPGRR